MALRLRIGKFRIRGFRFPRFGVRGSLFAAFAVIAGMAIVISAGAGFVLNHLGGAMTDLSGRDIPRLAASLQLSAESASLASQGPGLLASRSEDTLKERSKKMQETQQVTLQKLGEITRFGANKDTVTALTETVKNIDDMIKSLGSAASERLETAALHEKLYESVRTSQAAFVKAAAPAMVPPRWPSTRPAPALITIAMPAITAKAANRLPLTPHRGSRRGAMDLPLRDQSAIAVSPDPSSFSN